MSDYDFTVIPDCANRAGVDTLITFEADIVVNDSCIAVTADALQGTHFNTVSATYAGIGIYAQVHKIYVTVFIGSVTAAYFFKRFIIYLFFCTHDCYLVSLHHYIFRIS